MIVNSKEGYGSEVENKHLRKCGYFAIIFFSLVFYIVDQAHHK